MLEGTVCRNTCDSFKQEKQYRLDTKNKFFTGINYLDDCMQGILDGDLVVLTGDTGVGKTSITTFIAKHNAFLGKNVYYIALEAKDMEIERRIKYQYISRKYYKNGLHTPDKFNKYLTYKSWLRGNDKELIESLEVEVNAEYSEKLKKLNVIYRKTGDFGIIQLKELINKIKDKADLIILDHLHIFDIDPRYENQEMKIVMKELRDMATIHNKPIIAISHIRKNRNYESLLPEIQDLHGSSDISKIAYSIISVAPYYNNEYKEEKCLYNTQAPTLFRILKDREDSSLTRYIGCHIFDMKTGSYSPEYDIANITDCKKEFTPITKSYDKPHWHRNRC
jgi:replicative DNA helicase